MCWMGRDGEWTEGRMKDTSEGGRQECGRGVCVPSTGFIIINLISPQFPMLDSEGRIERWSVRKMPMSVSMKSTFSLKMKSNLFKLFTLLTLTHSHPLTHPPLYPPPPPSMRFRTLEIRWHDSKPIATCDFQPVPFKRARPPAGNDDRFAGHSYRLATGGEDNHVRVCLSLSFFFLFLSLLLFFFWMQRSGWSIPIFDQHLSSRKTPTPPHRALHE